MKVFLLYQYVQILMMIWISLSFILYIFFSCFSFLTNQCFNLSFYFVSEFPTFCQYLSSSELFRTECSIPSVVILDWHRQSLLLHHLYSVEDLHWLFTVLLCEIMSKSLSAITLRSLQALFLSVFLFSCLFVFITYFKCTKSTIFFSPRHNYLASFQIESLFSSFYTHFKFCQVFISHCFPQKHLLLKYMLQILLGCFLLTLSDH